MATRAKVEKTQRPLGRGLGRVDLRALRPPLYKGEGIASWLFRLAKAHLLTPDELASELGVHPLYLERGYLSAAKPSMTQVAAHIGDAFEDEGYPRSSRATVIRRFKALPKRMIILKREGAKAAWLERA